MAKLTPQQFAQMAGGNVNDIKPVMASSTTPQEVAEPKKGLFQRLGESFNNRASNYKDIQNSGQGLLSKTFQGLGQVAAGVGDVAGDVIATGYDALPEPVKDTTEAIGVGVLNTPIGQMGITALQQGMESWNQFKQANPETAGNLEAVVNIASVLPIGKATQLGVKGATTATKKVAGGIAEVAEALARGVEAGPITSGIIQGTKDMASKVPRFTGRLQEGVLESAAKAERLKTATPEIANAIRGGVDDKIINTVEAIDRATPQGQDTIKSLKEMVNIAVNNEGKIGVPERPEIVAGKAIENQFELVEDQRKNIGKQIGAEVDQLSKNIAVPMQDSFDTLKAVLGENGVNIDVLGELTFDGTKYSAKERAGIKELWNEASRMGENLTPRQVYDADKLFSKLQRESRLDGIGELFVQTPDGEMPLFSVFRDVFSNKLEVVAPQIKPLNQQYRVLARLKEDLEDSIIKATDLNVTKGMDVSKFAQTNLRRLTSDAQSAAAYREVTDQLEAIARALGYEGASAKELIDFATELRNIFKGSVPATSTTGILDNGIGGAIGKVLKAGDIKDVDKQRALVELINSL